MQSFGHNKHGPKTGGWAAVPLFEEGAGSPSNTMSPWPSPTSTPSGILVHPEVWPQQTLAENWMVLSPFWGAAVSPSDTMWPGARPTSIPSGILVHPTVWPQYTNVTDTQTGETTVR